MADTHPFVRVSDVICQRSDLVDGDRGGKAIRFEMVQQAKKTPCFVLAFKGAIHAYVNRCPHQGTELDWLPGEVFDGDGLYLICATHGAVFEPNSGVCVGGPCKGMSLQQIQIREVENDILLVDLS
jgi:nitrite reductase/ring-hydroxylating ferredoxin subunit